MPHILNYFDLYAYCIRQSNFCFELYGKCVLQVRSNNLTGDHSDDYHWIKRVSFKKIFIITTYIHMITVVAELTQSETHLYCEKLNFYKELINFVGASAPSAPLPILLPKYDIYNSWML